MSEMINVRKTVTLVETIRHEGGTPPEKPLKKGAILIVLKNPFAGSYVEDVLPMMDALKPVGLEAAQELISLLGGAGQIQSYGKGSIVGEDGELEHGALWHVPGGYAMREALGGRWRLFLLPRKSEEWAARLMSPSPTSTLPTSAVILMRWKFPSPMHPGVTRSSFRW